MLKKTFIVTMFGEPFSWIKEFVEKAQCLEPHGWNWLIFTPLPMGIEEIEGSGGENAIRIIQSKGNVRFIQMDCEQFNKLCEEKTGVKPKFFLTEKGTPSVHITDYYVASGLIFEDYLRGSDYWGIANLDIVFGRLDHFLPDDELSKHDIWTDDPRSFNGIFSLFKNTEANNNLFKQIPDWQTKFSQEPCGRCVSGVGNHTLYGTDEYDMSEILKDTPIGRPKHYPVHSHDRLEQHIPDIKLEIKEDGSLWELSRDVNGPDWIHAHPLIGREVPYFHFQKTKQWPKCLKQ